MNRIRYGRAYLREQRKRCISQRVRIAREFFSSNLGYIREPTIVPGWYAKRDPFDCGNSHCGLCHFYRGTLSHRDLRLHEAADYEYNEYYDYRQWLDTKAL